MILITGYVGYQSKHKFDVDASPLSDNFSWTVHAQEPHPKTKYEIIQDSKHPKEIDYIWLKESTRGKNDIAGSLQRYCENLGKSNEFGWGGMQGKICFDSFADSVRTVDQWLDTQVNADLCLYNIGIRKSNCNYVK